MNSGADGENFADRMDNFRPDLRVPEMFRAELKDDKDIQEFYLGFGGGEQQKSFRDAKIYQKRKRWLS